jgi:hypothetical protein
MCKYRLCLLTLLHLLLSSTAHLLQCSLLQYLLQSCSPGGGAGTREDMCYECNVMCVCFITAGPITVCLYYYKAPTSAKKIRKKGFLMYSDNR